MDIIIIILAVLLYAASAVLLYRKEVLGPAAALLGLCAVFWYHSLEAYGGVPMADSTLITWFIMTLIVTIASAMQPPALMAQRRGMTHMILGGVCGLAAGLLCFAITLDLSAINMIMKFTIAAGVFAGYYLFTKTPDGARLQDTRSRFFSYLLAKGFPVAIAIMMLGVPLAHWLFVMLFKSSF